VQTIYIDPPFNKEQDADYLYNVKFKDSTWISMLENRLRLARELLSERGSIFVRCDYNGNMFVRLLMNEIFGKENFRNEISVRRFRKNVMEKEIKKLPEGLDTIYLYSVSEKFSYIGPYKLRFEKRPGFWRHMGDSSGQGTPKVFFGKELAPPPGKHWKYSQEKINQMIDEGKLILECRNCGYIHDKSKGLWQKCPECGADNPIPKYWVEERIEEVMDSNWSDIYGYSTSWDFPTENSEILLKRVIESTSNEGDLVMDFFLGSGTTCAVAHKLRRKWIGIEMGEHFWTVVMPRMKKILFYDKSGISKEKDVKEKYNEKNAGGFFKYQILEQYEDALDNIELKENREAMELFKDEYLLKYFLDFETRESPYLLNIDLLKNPFNYKLKVNLKEVGEPEEMIIDIPETFNYLLGLKIKKIKYRKNYLFILGEKEGKSYAIVWRDWNEKWSDEEYIKDKEFIKQELKEWKPQVVYINGQSILTPNFGDFQVELRCTETEFKKLMER
jgi:adenine-specific DNA-methyltransferase